MRSSLVRPTPLSVALLYNNQQGATDPLTRAYYLANGTYYVDSVNGDDGNNGTSPYTPFRTFSALPALIGNENISLACGSMWLEQLDISVDGVRIGAYVPPQTGATAQPIIDCSDVVTTWLDSTDRADANTNVYSKAITTNTTGTITFINIFENAANLVNVSSLALCQSTVGSYFVSSHTSATPTVYIHPTGSTDPDTNGNVYRVTTRRHAITAANRINIILFDLEMRRPLHHDGVAKTGRNSTIHNCTFVDGNLHHLLFGGGSLVEDCTFGNTNHTTSQTHLVFNEDTPNGLDVTIRGCSFSVPVYRNTAVAIYGHSNISGSFGELVVEDCTFTRVGIAINVSAQVASLVATNNTATDCNEFLRASAAIVYTLSGNVYESLSSSSFKPVNTNAAGATINLTGDTYRVGSTNLGAIGVFHSNTILTIEASHVETVVNASAPVSVNSGLTGVALTINNSTIKSTNTQLVNDLSAATVYVADNNTFCASADADNFAARWHNTNYNTLAAWRSATGQDANSVVSCA